MLDMKALDFENFLFCFRPTCCTVEDLATDLRARELSDVVTEPLPNDLPPKYDDLEQPPKYEEHVQQQQQQQQQQLHNQNIL